MAAKRSLDTSAAIPVDDKKNVKRAKATKSPPIPPSVAPPGDRKRKAEEIVKDFPAPKVKKPRKKRHAVSTTGVRQTKTVNTIDGGTSSHLIQK